MPSTLSVFRKSLLEQLRSPWELAMVLFIPPVFVLLYWLFLGGGSTSYTLLILDLDGGPHAARVIASAGELTYPDGQPILKLLPAAGRAEAEARLRNRDAAALLVLPEGFSRRLDAAGAGGAVETSTGNSIIFSGDLTNPTYAVAAVMASSVVEDYLREVSGQPRPVPVVEEPLGGSATRSEFETYVPGLLVVAVVMMLFTAAMRITREVEGGGLKRLRLTRLTPFQFLAGVSAVQLLVGMAAVLLTFALAAALGFESQGPLWLAVLIGVLTSFSVIGAGLMVAAFARTSGEALIIANFPMVLMMFFSGGIFPIQRIPLFTLAGRTFALFDLLPQTSAVLALNKVLTLGAGPRDVLFEISMVLVLSCAYFALGVWLFGRRVMRRAV